MLHAAELPFIDMTVGLASNSIYFFPSQAVVHLFFCLLEKNLFIVVWIMSQEIPRALVTVGLMKDYPCVIKVSASVMNLLLAANFLNTEI